MKSRTNMLQRRIPIATHDPRSRRATIEIASADLLRSVYVIGKSGTGKSALLERVLLGAVDAGFGACLIDPHGDTAKRVLALMPPRHFARVIRLAPREAQRPVGIDVLSTRSGTSRALVASSIVEVFRKLWGPTLFGPRSEHVLRHGILALLESPGATLLGLLRLLVDETFRFRVVARVTDPVVRLFWLKEFPLMSKQFATEVMAPVLNKLGALAAPAVRRVIGQTAPRVNLATVMDAGFILVADLSGIGRDAAALLGALIVAGLGNTALARAGLPETTRRPFVLVADEFHAYATLAFATLLAESRKFGFCAVLANQHLAQIDDDVRAAILGNAGTLVAFRTSAEDAEILAPELAPDVTRDDLVALGRYEIALRLLHAGEPVRPVICKTIPPPIEDGTSPRLLQISRERWGRLEDVVDREIAEALGMSQQNEKADRSK